MTQSKEELLAQFEDMFGAEELNTELKEHLSTASYGQLLHHPLIIHIPHHDAMNKTINKQFTYKKQALENAIAEKNWNSYVFIHERPYRIDALETILYEFEIDDPEIIWPLIASVWVDSENIYQYCERWEDIWSHNAPNKHLTMDDKERAALKALPKTIMVYRGVAHESSVEGMSWTTDRKKAIWFARRFSADEKRTPLLAFGKVSKKNVLAHFLARNESEIVTFPHHVNVQSVEPCR